MYRVQCWYTTLTKHIKEFTHKVEINTKKIHSEAEKQQQTWYFTQINTRVSLAPGKNKNTLTDTKKAHGNMSKQLSFQDNGSIYGQPKL